MSTTTTTTTTIASSNPTSSPPPNPKFSIPTIDLSPLTSSSSASTNAQKERQNIITQIQEACLGSGFFQITGHGIDKKLQEKVFAGAEAFFKLGREEKEKVDMKKGGGRGWEVLAAQNLSSQKHTTTSNNNANGKATASLPDHKEGYYIGRSVSSSHPLVQRGAFLIGPNQWPSPSILPHEVFKDVMERYYEEMMELSALILGLIGEGLKQSGVSEKDEEREGSGKIRTENREKNAGFEGIYHANKGNSEFPNGEDVIASLRLLHYPPLPSSTTTSNNDRRDNNNNNKPQQLGAGPHTDFGFITLLMQDSIGGLEVLDPSHTSTSPGSNNNEQTWHPVPPNPEAYVVNIGDMLQMFTKGAFKSSVHRVVMEAGRGDRYSVPFFFDGRGGFVLRDGDDVGEGGGERDVLTVEGYMRERFRKTYGS